MTTKHRVQVAEGDIEYTVKRSRRRKKTVQVSIQYGKVVVAAPMRTPNREIQAIIRNRSGWILGKLEVSASEPRPLELVTGESLPYFGKQIALVVVEEDVRKPNARITGEHITVTVGRLLLEGERREATHAALVALYKAHAAEFLEEAVSRWLPVMGRFEIPKVLVREQRSRWGSCSSDGTLRFSWRLGMIEPDLIESVVVHELAHLDVMNHSRAFWDVVQKAMPDAKDRRKRLREAGLRLPL